MSSTDTRTGFRLPWNSDRSHDGEPVEAQVEAPVEAADEPAAGDVAWQDGGNPDAPSAEATTQSSVADLPAADPDLQEPAMIELDPSPAPAPVAPKKPSKLMVDLTAAIRATAVAARDQALAQVDTDVATVVEDIRNQSKDGETVLRQRSDEDVVGIREWSKLEIARIKEETEARIEARKVALASELTAHAAAVERRVDDVQDRAAVYRSRMADYADGLGQEDDPSRLATMAESMPEPPDLAGWAAMDDDPVAEAWLAVAAVVEPAMHAVAEVAVLERETVDAEAEAVGEWATESPVNPEAAAEAVAEPVADGDTHQGDAGDGESDPSAGTQGTQARTTWAAEAWGSAPEAWALPAKAPDAIADASPEEHPEAAGQDQIEGIDRQAVIAAFEASENAATAAEASAASAIQAAAAADIAETAAEMPTGRVAVEDGSDPEADAAFAARMDAGGFDTTTIADRLARMLPAQDDGVVDTEPRHDPGGRVGARVGGQHRELQAPPRPPRRCAGGCRRLRTRRRVRVQCHPCGGRLVQGRDPGPARLRRSRDQCRQRRRHGDGSRSRDGELIPMANPLNRPAVAILLPEGEREHVAIELARGGFDPVTLATYGTWRRSWPPGPTW